MTALFVSMVFMLGVSGMHLTHHALNSQVHAHQLAKSGICMQKRQHHHGKSSKQLIKLDGVVIRNLAQDK